LPVWKAVPEEERREIFRDCMHNLSKREKEKVSDLIDVKITMIHIDHEIK